MLLVGCTSRKDRRIIGEWTPVRTEIYNADGLLETLEGIGMDEKTCHVIFDRKYLTFVGEELFGIYHYDSENAILAFVGDFSFRVQELSETSLILVEKELVKTYDDDGEVMSEGEYTYIFYYKRCK